MQLVVGHLYAAMDLRLGMCDQSMHDVVCCTIISGCAGQRQLQEQQQRLVSMMSPAATAPPPRQGLAAFGSIVAPPTRP